MSEQGPALPTARELLDLDVIAGRELSAGKQSRVFAGTSEGRSIAVKFTDATMADRETLIARVLMTEQLAKLSAAVVAPVAVQGELVRRVGRWLLTATSLVEGTPPNVAAVDDAHSMGMTLSQIHASLAALPQFAIPPVRALDGRDVRGVKRWQLLHGDFSDKNVIVTPTRLRVFDFDDSGYGPVEYDLANSLYMANFDAEVSGTPGRSESFRAAFLEGYLSTTDEAIDVSDVNALIDLRVAALSGWLADLASAPIGIRTSTPAWREKLSAFVASHERSSTD